MHKTIQIILLTFTSSYAFSATMECFIKFESQDPSFKQDRGASLVDTRPYLSSDGSLIASRLCNDKYAVIWTPPDYGKFPVYINGRFYTDDGATSKDFRIVESDEPQWEYSFSPLTGGGFVVVWKTRDNTNRQNIIIRARVFNSEGVAETTSFDVSETEGKNARAMVAPMPDGGFVITWRLLRKGIFLKSYNPSFLPKINEKLVWEENTLSVGVPYIVVDTQSNISLFITKGSRSIINPFKYAFRFNSNGVSISRLFEGDAIKKVPGYKSACTRIKS